MTLIYLALAVAPFLERWRHVDWIRTVLKGVNAVVAGAIFGVALTLVPPAVPDLWSGVLMAPALRSPPRGQRPH
jgi:hypothetical protein